MSRLVSTVKIIVWAILFGMPVLFLFGGPAAMLTVDPVAELYRGGAELLGEKPARVLFCGLWFLAVALLFWRLVIRKENPAGAGSADLHD